VATITVLGAFVHKHMNLRYYFIILVTSAIVTGCSSFKQRLKSSLEKNPVVIETMSAGEFLRQLNKQSLLPGSDKDMIGELNSEKEKYPLPNEVVYPFSRTFQATYKGQVFTNNYTVIRESGDSPWRLKRAWQTDSSGLIVEEWPVK